MLSEAQRKWLSMLTDEFQAVNDITAALDLSTRSRSGVAGALGRLAKIGLAEWRVGIGASEYRLTEAGRRALKEQADE